MVGRARLVATTVSKLYADSLFDGQKYDAVMFDEISMAYIPQVIAAASFAVGHLICVGDFRQLAPIVQGPGDVLAKDLFEFLNISKGTDVYSHPWLVMLNEQRRMHPEIAAFSSKYVYNGLLKNHPDVMTSRNQIAQTEPFPSPMCLIDLYGTACFGSKNEGNSRFNILSALFSFAVALKAEKGQEQVRHNTDGGEVGIITPYAAQTRLIRAMILDYRKSQRETKVSCATVHQFQGSERNVVIFDSVESCPSAKAGWLMSKNDGGSVTRLINVAITRSIGKFIVIANKEFWLKKYESDNKFRSLIQYMDKNSYSTGIQNNTVVDYLESGDFGRTIKVFTSLTYCSSYVLPDIRNAKDKVVLMLPPGTINSEFAKPVLDEILQKARYDGCAVIKYDESSVIPSEYKEISTPSGKITMPLLFVDNHVWYGLPVYNHIYSEKDMVYPIWKNIIIRFSGSHTVEMIESLVSYNQNDWI